MTTDERETYLDEFVGPQLEPQSLLHQSGELLKALGALNWSHDNQHAASTVQTVALNVLFERLQKAHLAYELQSGVGCSW